MNFVWFQYRSIHGNVNAWVGVITLKKKKINLARRLPKRVEPWFIFANKVVSNSGQELIEISPFWIP